jgi:phage gpG-like protein
MIAKTKVTLTTRMHRVARRAADANIETLAHAGAALRRAAIRGIHKRKGASPPGQPPFTHTNRLRRAIKYAVEPRYDRVIIGPDKESIGLAGAIHEHGGNYRGRHYPKRPFMAPALERVKPRLPAFWKASIR